MLDGGRSLVLVTSMFHSTHGVERARVPSRVAVPSLKVRIRSPASVGIVLLRVPEVGVVSFGTEVGVGGVGNSGRAMLGTFAGSPFLESSVKKPRIVISTTRSTRMIILSFFIIIKTIANNITYI